MFCGLIPPSMIDNAKHVLEPVFGRIRYTRTTWLAKYYILLKQENPIYSNFRGKMTEYHVPHDEVGVKVVDGLITI